MTVKIVAFVTVKPGADDAFIAAARICVAASRAEPGVLHYDLWRETAGDRRFVFNELYTDDAAVQAHMAVRSFQGVRPGRPRPRRRPGPKSSRPRPWTSPTDVDPNA